jgi:hypothetical protein
MLYHVKGMVFQMYFYLCQLVKGSKVAHMNLGGRKLKEMAN